MSVDIPPIPPPPPKDSPSFDAWMRQFYALWRQWAEDVNGALP